MALLHEHPATPARQRNSSTNRPRVTGTTSKRLSAHNAAKGILRTPLDKRTSTNSNTHTHTQCRDARRRNHTHTETIQTRERKFSAGPWRREGGDSSPPGRGETRKSSTKRLGKKKTKQSGNNTKKKQTRKTTKNIRVSHTPKILHNFRCPRHSSCHRDEERASTSLRNGGWYRMRGNFRKKKKEA